MTAIELLEWFKDHNAKDLTKIFGSKSICVFTKDLSAQEILDRIEKHEADKNHIAEGGKKDAHDIHVGTIAPDLKAGDCVRLKGTHDKVGYMVVKCATYMMVLEDIDGKRFNDWKHKYEKFEHAEPPKEEKKWCPTCKHQGEPWVSDCCKYCNKNEGRDDNWESKEERQKIEKIDRIHWIEIKVTNELEKEICNKINELVDAVNELRGVE